MLRTQDVERRKDRQLLESFLRETKNQDKQREEDRGLLRSLVNQLEKVNNNHNSNEENLLFGMLLHNHMFISLLIWYIIYGYFVDLYLVIACYDYLYQRFFYPILHLPFQHMTSFGGKIDIINNILVVINEVYNVDKN